METNYKKAALGVLAILIVGGLIWFGSKNGGFGAGAALNYKDATYQIENEKITLHDGKAETDTVPGSASKTVIQYFGNEARGDVNSDGTEDVAFLITRQSGGSGTFFYAVVALKGKTGYIGSNAVFLGDRIAPQSTTIEDGKVVVNFAGVPKDAPMSDSPSVGMSKYLSFVNGQLIEATLPAESTSTRTSGTVQMKGTVVCLPHKNTAGPQTMECAYGLKDDNGIYYGLADTDPSYTNVMGLPMNETVQVEGTIEPIGGNNNYQSVATIHVTKILK